MKRLLISLTAIVMILGMTTYPVAAGSIVLTGHDPDFHAASGETGEITFNQRAIQYM